MMCCKGEASRIDVSDGLGPSIFAISSRTIALPIFITGAIPMTPEIRGVSEYNPFITGDINARCPPADFPSINVRLVVNSDPESASSSHPSMSFRSCIWPGHMASVATLYCAVMQRYPSSANGIANLSTRGL